MDGWIKLHRKITEHEIWSDVMTFRLFMLLLIKATHQETKMKGIVLQRGQYVRSYSKLAEDLGYKEGGRGLKTPSKSTVSRSVKKLIDNGMIAVHETEHGTVFTVLKYELYQGFEAPIENESGTVSETNPERTQNEPETNGERTQNENKNAKNNNNAKNAKKDKKDTSPKKRVRVYQESDIPYRLALTLCEGILANNPAYRFRRSKEDALQKWADVARLMMEKDQRTKEQIAYVINWSQKNSFWSGNIQSMSTLREQYDKLIVQIKNEQQNDQRKVEQQQERHIGPVPEWFKNRNKEQRDTSLSPEEAAYFEAERQKVLAMLGKRDTQQSS